MQLFVNSVERLNSTLYPVPPCILHYIDDSTTVSETYTLTTAVKWKQRSFKVRESFSCATLESKTGEQFIKNAHNIVTENKYCSAQKSDS